MGAILGLLAAVTYGVCDFTAGVGSRRGSPSAVTVIEQAFGLAVIAIVVLVTAPQSPTAATLWWGALSGVGSGFGTVALIRGLSSGAMSVVAPVSAVLAAVIPAIVGVAIGERLSAVTLAGVALAVPAILLVSLQSDRVHGRSGRSVVAGLIAGGGFALLFIALDQAGTSAGAWPLLPGQAVAEGIVIVLALQMRPSPGSWRVSLPFGAIAGILGGTATILYLAATGGGQLAVVAVLTSLYPAVTVLLARFGLHERFGRVQGAGLLLAAIAIGMITAG